MRSWTFKRKINAAQQLAAFLASTEMAGPPQRGEGEGKPEWGQPEVEEYKTGNERKQQQQGQGQQAKGEKGQSQLNDGQSFQQKGEGEDGEPADMDGEGHATQIDEWKQPINKEIREYYESMIRGYPQYLRNNGEWADMPIETFPLERKKNTRGSQAVPEGVMLRYPHRYATDMSLFKRSHGHQWGSLLVDNSGSMALDPEDLYAFIKAVPAANIAYYTKSHGNGGLYVLAQKGLIASDERLRKLQRWGGNGVDGPALRWLATQPKPRIWVSDGYVTGKSSCVHMNLLQDCANICKANRILRVPTMEKALELVRSGRGGVHA